MVDPAVYPGPQFWEQVRQESARTEVSSVEVFQRDEMPWILARFSMAWESLELLDESVPQVRFASFVALAGYRFVVTGYRWVSRARTPTRDDADSWWLWRPPRSGSQEFSWLAWTDWRSERYPVAHVSQCRDESRGQSPSDAGRPKMPGLRVLVCRGSERRPGTDQ